MGEGRGNLSGERFPLPHTPSLPKTVKTPGKAGGLKRGNRSKRFLLFAYGELQQLKLLHSPVLFFLISYVEPNFPLPFLPCLRNSLWPRSSLLLFYELFQSVSRFQWHFSLSDSLLSPTPYTWAESTTAYAHDPHISAPPKWCSLGGSPVLETNLLVLAECYRTKPFSCIWGSKQRDTCTPKLYDLNFTIAS